MQGKLPVDKILSFLRKFVHYFTLNKTLRTTG